VGEDYTRSAAGAPDGDYMVLQFDTVFSGKGDAVETVTMKQDDDGRWRVSAYAIR
jgi:hypothetical protein